MGTDSIDRIIQAWAQRDPTVDARPLEVVGRLLLCAEHCRRDLVAALRPFDLQAIIAADEAFLQPLDQRQRDAVATAPADRSQRQVRRHQFAVT